MHTFLMLISQNPNYFEAFLTKQSQVNLEEALSSFSPALGKTHLPLEMSMVNSKVMGIPSSY